MKTVYLLLLSSLLSINAIGQRFDSKYGKPLITLVERNPWLMVVGSDVPSFAAYENGQIIFFKRSKNKVIGPFETRLSPQQLSSFIAGLKLDSLRKLPAYTVAFEATDQANNTLTINLDSLFIRTVYGGLNDNFTPARRNSPKIFLNVYDKLVRYQNPAAKAWIPDTIEIMVRDYSYSPLKPMKWPTGWPDIKDKGTINRNSNSYSIFLPS